MRWALNALALGAALAALALPPAASVATHQLEVRAIGQKNAGAKGSEIWIIGLYGADLQPAPLDDFERTPGWALADGKLVYSGASPAAARWRGSLAGAAELHLVSHPWSGIAEITWDGQKQIVDLFNELEGGAVKVLPFPAPPASSRTVFDWLVAFADTLCLGALALAASLWLAAYHSDARRRPRSRKRLLALLTLLTLPASLVLAPTIFAGPDKAAPIPIVAYPLAWLYSLGVVAAIACFMLSAGRVSGHEPARLPQRLRWLVSEVWGQTAGAWLLALAGSALLAALLVSRLGIGVPQAMWAKVWIDAPGAQAPAVRLHYGAGAADTAPFRWQPYPETVVAVRPLDGAQTITVSAAETNAGPLDLATISANNSTLTPNGLQLADLQGTMLRWPQPTHALTLTLTSGAGRAELLWLDGNASVDLAQPAPRLALALPAAFQGWAMLPPREVEQLSLEVAPTGEAYTLRGLAIPGVGPEANMMWAANNAAAWAANGCGTQPGPRGPERRHDCGATVYHRAALARAIQRS